MSWKSQGEGNTSEHSNVATKYNNKTLSWTLSFTIWEKYANACEHESFYPSVDFPLP